MNVAVRCLPRPWVGVVLVAAVLAAEQRHGNRFMVWVDRADRIGAWSNDGADQPVTRITYPSEGDNLAASCICGSDLWPCRGVEPIDGPRPMGQRTGEG